MLSCKNHPNFRNVCIWLSLQIRIDEWYGIDDDIDWWYWWYWMTLIDERYDKPFMIKIASS